MASYPYVYGYAYTYPSFFSILVPALALAVTVVGGLALYFLFARRPGRAHGAAARLHEFLTFRTFYTERILGAVYCITVAGISVYSVVLLFSHFVLALLLFVLGNLIARVVFEYALLLLVLCRNAQEINRKMGPLPGAADEPQEPPVPPQAGVVPSVQPQVQPGAQPPQAHAEPPVQPHPQSDPQPPQPPVPPQE